MDVEPLPTGNYTVVVIAGALSLVYAVVAVYTYRLDNNELNKCKIVFFQDNIGENDALYCISMAVKEKICHIGVSDLLLRLRGVDKDSPLILYRDSEGSKFVGGSVVNIGVALPYNVGNLVELDLACDNDCCDEGEAVLNVSDVYVRELPRSNLPGSQSNPNRSWKRRASSALFTSLGVDLLAWVCIETITNTAGAGVVGLENIHGGRNHLLRARDICYTLPLTKESARIKKRAKVSYRSLHYLFSLSPRWHDAWSDFSRLDHVFVMFLDQITGMVVASASFAYAMEVYFGVERLQNLIQPSLPPATFTDINHFDLTKFIGSSSKEWFLQNVMNLIHIVWIAIISSLMTIPLSLVWCRLFRFIGGKNFDEVYQSISPEYHSDHELHRPEDVYGVVSKPSRTSLMLRTLECKSLHTGSNVQSTRRLRLEQMISNCLPDNITARSVAYIRTKMSRLREDDLVGAGENDLENPKVLHESHTQSTDAPHMPLPVCGPDGSGEVVGVARYCERLVQQASQHIRDKSVIAECFEIAPEGYGTTSDAWDKKSAICCARQCCKRNLKCRQQETFSNATFFTEEDAASLKEMISNFSLSQVHMSRRLSSATDRLIHPVQADLEGAELETEDDNEEDLDDDDEDVYDDSSDQIDSHDSKKTAPTPSGRLRPIPMPSKRRIMFRNSGGYIDEKKSKSLAMRTHKTSKTPDARKSEKGEGMVCIGRRPTDRSEPRRDNVKNQSKNITHKVNPQSRTQNHIQPQAQRRTHRPGIHNRTEPASRRTRPVEHLPPVPQHHAQVAKHLPSVPQHRTQLVEHLPPVTQHRTQLVEHLLPASHHLTQLSHRSSKGRAVKCKQHKVPFPSAFAESSFSEEKFYNVTPPLIPQQDSRTELQRKRSDIPFKGTKFKVGSFLLLAIVQLLEIYFVTAFESESNNHFYVRPDTSTPPYPGRMHAAALSSIFSLLVYFMFTVHLIALLSFAIELTMNWWFTRKENEHLYYDDREAYSVLSVK